MSYLYGIRYKHPENALILSLRQVSPRTRVLSSSLIKLSRNFTHKTTIPYTGPLNEITLLPWMSITHTQTSSTSSTSSSPRTNPAHLHSYARAPSHSSTHSSVKRMRTLVTRHSAPSARCSTSSVARTSKGPSLTHIRCTSSDGWTSCGLVPRG